MKKILVIADDWERLERYEERLHSLFDFRSSPFGGHGIGMAAREKPDLIIIDLEFEDMSGQEALTLMRSDKILTKVPIVLIADPRAPTPAAENVHVFLRPISLDSLVLFLRSPSLS